MDALTDPTAALVWIPCPNAECAARIGRDAVERRLAACANILPAMRSIYRWKGETQDDAETLLALKTSQARVDSLIERVVALHPYELPAVSVLPVIGGHPPFLDWIGSETAPPPPG